MTTEPETVACPGARAMLYRDAPAWGELKCAAVGGIEFETAAAGRDLLNEIAGRLSGEGFAAIIGPMDGDTWHRYRLVTETDGSLPFLMEPDSGPCDLEAFTDAGFEPISRYVSARARLADTIDAEPFSMPGVTVTPWDGRDAEGLIGKLFEMSGSSFSGNHFYKPITLDAFLDIYRPVLPMIDPEHVLFARTDGGDLVGFLFDFPDRLSGERKPAAVLKTYASGLRGVGHLLADTYHRRAIGMGFEDVIHALMHEENVSSSRSAQHNARIFRRYALMGRKL